MIHTISRVLVSDLRAHVNQTVTVSGWANALRLQRKMQFVILRDHSGVAQVTYKRDGGPLEAVIESLTPESAVRITGRVVEAAQVNLGGLEIVPETIEALNRAEKRLPIDEKTGPEHRLDWRFLDVGDVECPLRAIGASGLIDGEGGNVPYVHGLDHLSVRRRDDDRPAALGAREPPGEAADILAGPQDHSGPQEHHVVPEGGAYGSLSAGLREPILRWTAIGACVPERLVGVRRALQQRGVFGEWVVRPPLIDGDRGDVHPPGCGWPEEVGSEEHVTGRKLTAGRVDHGILRSVRGEPLQVVGTGPITLDGVGALHRTRAASVERRDHPPAPKRIINDRPAKEPGATHHQNWPSRERLGCRPIRSTSVRRSSERRSTARLSGRP